MIAMITSGAFWFGLVIGYVTYRTLKHTKDSGISDIASVIAAVGGAAIVTLFPADSSRFDFYAIGLAVGFFLYLGISMWLGESVSATLLGNDENGPGDTMGPLQRTK
jgi:NhaP-type Na+/H+ or K+/H+ antiporter